MCVCVCVFVCQVQNHMKRSTDFGWQVQMAEHTSRCLFGQIDQTFLSEKDRKTQTNAI